MAGARIHQHLPVLRSHEVSARARFDIATKNPRRTARGPGTPRYLKDSKDPKEIHKDQKGGKHAPGDGHDKAKDKEKSKKAKDKEGKDKDGQGHDKKDAKGKHKDAKGGKGKGGGGKGAKGKGGGGGGGKGKGEKKEGKEGHDASSGGPEGTLSGHKTGGPVDQPDLEFRAIPAIPMAKTGNFYPPIVEEPPEFVVKQDASIIKDTGISSREHHARIRRAVEAITRACSEAQIDMVRRVTARAWDVRFEIEKLADQIPAIVGGGVAMVTAAVKQCKADVAQASANAIKDITDMKFDNMEEITKNRDDANKNIVESLKGTSTALHEFADGITAAFKAKMGEAAGYIRDIPNTGAGKEISGLEFEKELAEKAAKADKIKHPKHQDPPKPKRPDLKVMGDAEKDIAGHLAGEGNQLTLYANSACAANLPEMIKNRQEGMVQAAEKRAKALDSADNMAAFFTLSVGLINPAAGAAERDMPQIQVEEKRENDQEMLKLMDARQQAVWQIQKTQEDTEAYLAEKLKDWVEDLHTAGKKVRTALLNQSRAAEVGLASAAAQMADNYPDIVRRLYPVVQGGKWLDSRQVLPQLDEAQRGAGELHDQHLKVINDQANETLQGARDGFEQQRKGLVDQAQKLSEGAYDTGTQITFDIMSSAVRFTGKMGTGSKETTERARKYAEKTAKDLLERTKRMKGKGVPPLEACAIRFLNQGIHGFEAEYHMSVANAEDEFETPGLGNQFPEIRKTLLEGVQKRADDCHAALPEPPGFWDYAGAVVVGGVLGGGVGALAGVGYLLWDSSPNTDKVFKALTDHLPFPGTRVVADVYDSAGTFKYKNQSGEYAKGYGNLEKHIRERLDNPEKDKTLGLFSSDAGVRADSKNWIIKDSTSIFGASKEAREAAASGLDKDERAALKASGDLETTKELLKKELGKLDFQMNEAFLDGNEGRALAMRVEKKLQDAQEKGNADIVTITGDLENLARQELGGTYGNAFIPPSRTEGLLNEMFVEHAKAFSGEAGQKADLSQEDARKLFTQHAQDMLWKYDQAYGAKPAPGYGAAYGTVGWDKEHPEQAAQYKQPERPTVKAAKDAIDAQVMAAGSKDEGKQDAAFAARGAYEIQEGERVGSGETTQTRINALEDRQWTQMKFAYEHASPADQAAMSKEYVKAQKRHEARMQMVMDKLPVKDGIPKSGNAVDYVAKRTGALLSGESSGQTYGEEMIRNGRASLTASIRMATEKWGTHEELINHALEGRSQQEQDEEEQRFKKETGESIHTRLYGTGGWFGGGELSGDDAQRAKEIQAGSAGTDRAMFEQAALQFHNQAVEGTGFLSEGTMASSPEKRNLYKSRDQLARMLMAASGRPNGDPSKVFGPDGRINYPYSQAFDKNGKLIRATDPITHKPIGRMVDLNATRSSMLMATTAIKTNADAYKAAVDKQEAFWTRLITALAIVVSIALMFIPGVNLIVAGIIVAVLAGAATMAVKAGFRGGRYGWEEAATDVGMTAIEAATAGIGGGMGRGAAAAEKAALRGGTLAAREVSGTLAKVGVGLTNKLGRVGGTIAREAIVGAVGGAARTALNENTWKEGFISGFGEVALGGLKGAAVSAVSAGVSQGISSKIGKTLAPSLDPSKAGLGSRIGEKLGETGRHMISSVASQTLGAMAATATDIIIDTARGKYEGGLKDALLAIGETGLRELFSSAGRSAAEASNQARFRELKAAARKLPPGALTDRDLQVLKLAAKSAGAHDEAFTHEELQAAKTAKARGESGDPMLQRMKNEVAEGQQLMAGMPKAVQEKLAGMDAIELRKLRALLTNPALGTSEQKLNAYHAMLKDGVHVDPKEFFQMLDQSRPGVVAHEEGVATQRKQVRAALAAHLEDSAKSSLRGMNLEDLAQLPPEHLQAAGKMIASGKYDERVAAELFAAAQAKSPGLVDREFNAKLKGAVASVTATRQMEKEATATRREAVLGPKKDEVHAALSGLDDDGIKVVKHLMDSGAEGSPALREALYQQAQKGSPGLDKETFFKGLGTAVKRAADERTEVRRAARIERVQRLAEYPPHVRGPLSALPEEALFQVRLAAARGEEISPQLRQQLHDAALRETPTGKVNLAKLDAAVDEAVKTPAKALRNASDDPKLRSELLSAVPTDLRVKMQDTPIVVMEGKDFEHFTGSKSGQAVTAIVEGQPVVVMRKGADPRVLREEGVHALQAHDQRWQEHVGQLNEGKLRDWKQLPLEEQLKLYQTKVELEIDAQLQVKRSLESELAGTTSKADREALTMELARAEATLDNLAHRHDEVAHVNPLQKRAVELGLLDRGKELPFLDQAPRLFSKGRVAEGEPGAAGDPRRAPPRKVILEPFAGPDMDSPIDLLKRNPGALVIATEANNQPPPEQLARLQAAGGAFVPENIGNRIPASSVDEIKMRFPLPADAAPQQAWAAKMRDLQALHPGEPDSVLMVKALADNDLSRRYDSLEAYAPYALQVLKPGGTMEVVFFEGHISHEAHAAAALAPFRDPDGKLYRLELESLGQEPKRTVAPKSGWLVPLKGEDPLVNVARFRKVEVLESPTGARGPASGRDFDPEQAGGPVRHLDFSKVKFTTGAVDVVEAHIRRFENGGGGAELAMLARLRAIVAGEIPATDHDRAFYTHELREFVRYRRMGWAAGQPLDGGASYDLWNNTHTATLEDYRIRERLPNGEWALFHPDIVVEQQLNGPTGARGPAPKVDWDTDVPLGIRGAAAHDPDPTKGQCATWVWVQALRNAGWSGAVAVDPRAPSGEERPMGSLIRNLRDPLTGDKLPAFSGAPEELVSQASRLPPGTQIVISVRSQSGTMHQMLGVVQGDGSLEVMHSFAPDRVVGPKGGKDRIYYGEQAELAQFTEHRWWVLPRLPPPPPAMALPLETETPLALDGASRKRMEGELHGLGHDPEVTKLLSDRELFSAYTQAQAKLTSQRIDEFASTLSWQQRGELDSLRTSGGLARKPVSETNLRNRVQAALGTPVVVDPDLKSGEVQVAYKKGLFGQTTGLEIRVGTGATLEDVLLHIPTLQSYKRYQGLTGAVRRITDAVVQRFAAGGRIPPGSMAEEAWNEVRKLPAIIEARQRRLGDPDLGLRERVQLEGEVEQLEKQLAGYARELANLGEGRGYVAAKLEGAERMQAVFGKILETLVPDQDWLKGHLDEMDQLVATQAQLKAAKAALDKEEAALRQPLGAHPQEAHDEYAEKMKGIGTRRTALEAQNTAYQEKLTALQEQLEYPVGEHVAATVGGMDYQKAFLALQHMDVAQLEELVRRTSTQQVEDMDAPFFRLWGSVADSNTQSRLLQLLEIPTSTLKPARLYEIVENLSLVLDRHPDEVTPTLIDAVRTLAAAGNHQGALDRIQAVYTEVASRQPTAVAQTIVNQGLAGQFQLSQYHGDERHAFPDATLQAILSTPDAVYWDGEVFTFRRGDDVAIVEGTGQVTGQVITAYGPSGILGATGAVAVGGAEMDRGAPVTDEMITRGWVSRGGGKFFRKAKQVWP